LVGFRLLGPKGNSEVSAGVKQWILVPERWAKLSGAELS